MSMRITVPWQIRMPNVRARSHRSGSWWNRKHFRESEPVRSVTMKADDLDHLGALHHVIEHRSKR